jgi:pimeloyl-ACP methyl ester carboxylesterase
MPSNAFEDIKTANVNGTSLAYREEGEGGPVVFVHGALSDLRTWMELHLRSPLGGGGWVNNSISVEGISGVNKAGRPET